MQLPYKFQINYTMNTGVIQVNVSHSSSIAAHTLHVCIETEKPTADRDIYIEFGVENKA